MRRLIIDLETGGLNPAKDGITQIAAVVADYESGAAEPVIVEVFSRLLRPESSFNYERRALEIQGKTIADLEEHGSPVSKSLADLYAFVSEHMSSDVMTVSPWAHNAAFDVAFLDSVCKKVRAELPCNRAYKCSMVLWRVLGELGKHSECVSKLDTVLSHYGIYLSDDDRHSATGDAVATAKALGYMLDDLHSKEIRE